MSELDKAIHDTLSGEDAEFLARFDAEPGSIRQMAGTFSGPFGWMSTLFVAVAVPLGIAMVYTGWKFFQVQDLRIMIQLGFVVVVCLLVLVTVRIWFFMQIQTNRILRELKRVELQVARLSKS